MRYLWLLILVFLFVHGGTALGQSANYAVTGEGVNVRSGPGTGYSKVGKIGIGDTLKVLYFYDDDWARVESQAVSGYVSTQYISRIETEELVPKTPSRRLVGAGKRIGDFLYDIYKIILVLCFIVVLLAGWLEKDWGAPALLLLIPSGIGALIGWFFLGNGRAGAMVGMAVGIVYVLKIVADAFGTSGFRGITYLLWYIVSFPFYVLNLAQFYLAKPWRPLMKKNRLPDDWKPAMRVTLKIFQVPFYVALFPLRLVNAFYYNLLVHNMYELSNYALEVTSPSDWKEGRGRVGRWMLMFPYRIVKYLFLHGGLTLLESVIWTIVDTFVPALTLYHGTRGEFADSMLCEPKRNERRRRTSGWLSGIWNVGGGNYAGDGIYFGIFRKTLRNYQDGAAIVARVTMGRTIDVALMPNYVYWQAGHPDAKAVSDWGLDNGYVSGEWWRADRDTRWWEICLYDRQNKYNESWRIRPIYVINSLSGIMQRIPGGTAHWLFRGMVWRDIRYSVSKMMK